MNDDDDFIKMLRMPIISLLPPNNISAGTRSIITYLSVVYRHVKAGRREARVCCQNVKLIDQTLTKP